MEKRKPNVILEYNQWKSGVDLIDSIIKLHTCQKKTNRWPHDLFFNLIDFSTCNGFTVLSRIKSRLNENMSKTYFFKELARQLIMLHIMERDWVHLQRPILNWSVGTIFGREHKG